MLYIKYRILTKVVTKILAGSVKYIIAANSIFLLNAGAPGCIL